MFDIRSAFGLRVHTPCGPRKSGMPESVDMPAPVSTVTAAASRSRSRTRSTPELSAPGPVMVGSRADERVEDPRQRPGMDDGQLLGRAGQRDVEVVQPVGARG